MHPLIDEKTVDTIRATGKASEHLPDRIGILEQHGLPYDREAETVIITGCQVLSPFAPVLQSLGRTLDRRGIPYTFLSKEFCCGNTLYRPAIKAKNEEALAECRNLSREFVTKNMQRAKALGARRLVIFCSPCYPIFKFAFPEEEILFYPQLIEEAIEGFRYDGKIDYYAGCYRLHRRFAPVPMDLASTDRVFDKMQGLEVHAIDAPKCCFAPEGLAHMIDNVNTDTLVHICTGCYLRAKSGMGGDSRKRVLMLPEFVEAALEAGVQG